MTKLFGFSSKITTVVVHSTQQSPPPPTSQQKRRVTRCLFGRPKPGETDQYLRKQLGEIQQESRRKWGYDFGSDAPILPAESDCKWRWTSLTSDAVPAFYGAVESSSSAPETDALQARIAVDSAILDARKSDESTPKKRKIPQEEIPSSTSAKKNLLIPPVSPKKRTRVDHYFGSRKRSLDGSSQKSQQKPVSSVEKSPDRADEPVSSKVSRFSASLEESAEPRTTIVAAE